MLLRLTTLVAPFLGAMLFAAPMLFAGSDGALAQAPAGSPPVRVKTSSRSWNSSRPGRWATCNTIDSGNSSRINCIIFL